MKLEKEEIEGIARLARLTLEETDIESYRKDLSGILELIEEMKTVDTSSVPPLQHPLEICARLREDRVTEPELRDKYQSVAPATMDGYYLVPKVIE